MPGEIIGPMASHAASALLAQCSTEQAHDPVAAGGRQVIKLIRPEREEAAEFAAAAGIVGKRAG